MLHGVVLAMVAVWLVILTTGTPAAPARAKCTSLSARCAVEFGGTCDPVTGRWRYSCAFSASCGARFNDCITRGLAGKKS